jgi:hypothetical protein
LSALSIPPPITRQRPIVAPRTLSRRRIGQRHVQLPPTFWAVSCCVCEQIGPISTSRTRGTNPTTRSGWRYLHVHQVGGWWCRGCVATRRRLLPPPTRGPCIKGPRPCPHALCRYHLAFDISRKAKDDFELEDTCALDVVDQHQEGMTLRELGAKLGMTREGAREIEVLALPKLRAIPGLEDLEFEDIDEQE